MRFLIKVVAAAAVLTPSAVAAAPMVHPLRDAQLLSAYSVLLPALAAAVVGLVNAVHRQGQSLAEVHKSTVNHHETDLRHDIDVVAEDVKKAQQSLDANATALAAVSEGVSLLRKELHLMRTEISAVRSLVGHEVGEVRRAMDLRDEDQSKRINRIETKLDNMKEK